MDEVMQCIAEQCTQMNTHFITIDSIAVGERGTQKFYKHLLLRDDLFLWVVAFDHQLYQLALSIDRALW